MAQASAPTGNEQPWPAAIDPTNWKPCTEIELSTRTAAVQSIQKAVQDAMAANDASHDFAHIARVHAAALSIAAKEGLSDDKDTIELIELTALLHDVDDWKYKVEGQEQKTPAQYLDSIDFDSDKSKLICSTISSMGFKESLGNSTGPETVSGQAKTLLSIVQDADRLDAIGAFGIARCLTYGGAKKRRLFDPTEPPKLNMTKEEYMANKDGTTLNHFYEKLFFLKDNMRTATGRAMAEARHQVMVAFVQQLLQEQAGLA